MSTLVDVMSGQLAPTATYARRSWVWLTGPFPDNRLGNLTVVLQHAERNGRKKPVAVESDTYAVDEEPLIGVMGRKFLLLNLTDPKQDDVYEVVIGPHGDTCTCDAGKVDRGYKRKGVGELECKHRAACRAIIEEGGL